VPDSWVTKQEGDVLVTTAPSGEAWVAVVTIDADDVKAVGRAIDKEINSRFRAVRVTKTKPVTLNGLSAIAVDAKGKTPLGIPVELGAVAVFNPNGKELIAFGAVRASRQAVYNAALTRIVTSIHR
jgi:hypothetical protein